MFRYRRFHKQYDNHIQQGCPFCQTYQEPKLIETTQHAQVVKNNFPYNLWEGKEVIEHLMILPKRHVPSLEYLHNDELLDIMQLIAKYEAANYNVYARGVTNNTRSVVHQHTHLIKISNTKAKFFFYLAKPYVVFKV